MFENYLDDGTDALAFGEFIQAMVHPVHTSISIDAIRQTVHLAQTGSSIEQGVKVYVEPYESQTKHEASCTEQEDLQGPPGSLLEVKRIDEVYDQNSGEWTTRDSITTHSGKGDRDKHSAYAFTVNRKFKPTNEKGMHVVTTTLDVKSEHLREVGMLIIGRVQGISWTSKPLKVDPTVLLAFFPQLTKYETELKAKFELERRIAEESTISVRLSHLSFLNSFIHDEYAETLGELNSLLIHGEISFELLWALFVPRSILYMPCPVTGSPRAVRVRSVELRQKATEGAPSAVPGAIEGAQFWAVDAEYIEFNAAYASGGGQPMFGYAQLINMEIPFFVGTQKITNLPFYPMNYYHNSSELRARLIERGKRWTSLQGVHHLFYDGLAFRWDEQERKYKKQTVKSRMMIDRGTYVKTLPNYRLPKVTKTLTGEDIDKHPRKSCDLREQVTDVNNFDLLSDEELMLASPVVYGFSLGNKRWFELDVDNVSTFEWNDEAFENLVLPPEQKDLVKSLAEAHTFEDSGFDDFIGGKGRGLVINLFGSPGVGKSLTAEAASEHVRKPLYVVGAGELGTDAPLVDIQLRLIFELAATWGAIVLIDEADVFLEERSLHQIERNAMVAVFLRQLEYFRGILFLTTNRVRTFDEAFQSRIHVSILYPDLSSDAKRKIWVAMLRKATPQKVRVSLAEARKLNPYAGLSRAQLYELGEKKVNGRQIKNVVRTACAIASSKKEDMSYEHLVQVLDMMDQFDARSGMYQ